MRGKTGKIQKKYWIDEEIARATRVRAAIEGITQSAFAERAITNFLKERSHRRRK